MKNGMKKAPLAQKFVAKYQVKQSLYIPFEDNFLFALFDNMKRENLHFSPGQLSMNPNDLRNLGCDEMEKLWRAKHPFILNQVEHVLAVDAAARNEVFDFDTYVQRRRKPGSWVDENSILAMSLLHALKTDLVVLTKDNHLVYTASLDPNERSSSNPPFVIGVAYDRKKNLIHFQSYIPRPGNDMYFEMDVQSDQPFDEAFTSEQLGDHDYWGIHQNQDRQQAGFTGIDPIPPASTSSNVNQNVQNQPTNIDPDSGLNQGNNNDEHNYNFNAELVNQKENVPTIGFQCIDKAVLQNLSVRFKGVTSETEMKINGRKPRKCTEAKNHECQNIREFFPSAVKARIRCVAIDPFGYMSLSKSVGENYVYKCGIENCSASLTVRDIDNLDTGGGNILGHGLYGCYRHSHPLEVQKTAEIELVFESKQLADDFIVWNKIDRYYRSARGPTGDGIEIDDKKGYHKPYKCRRPGLIEERSLKKEKGILMNSFFKTTNFPQEIFCFTILLFCQQCMVVKHLVILDSLCTKVFLKWRFLDLRTKSHIPNPDCSFTSIWTMLSFNEYLE